MLICAMDTSGPTAGVALLMDGVIRYEAVARNKQTHSESAMPMLEEAFIHAGLRIDNVDYFAVTVGPGSFTGVRIGVTMIKGLSHAEAKPCIGVDALEALAQGVSLFDGVLCPIQDARAGQVYGAAFEGLSMKRLMEDEPLKLEEYVGRVAALSKNGKLLFTGDGVPVNQGKIEALLDDRAVFAPADSLYLRPASVAVLAQKALPSAVTYHELTPLYLRAPQAERQKNLVENKANG